MSMKEEYAQYLAIRSAVEAESKAEFHLDQEKRYVEPFNLYGPIWYVGDDWVCVHLIDTGDGLLLIDSGNCGAQAMLIYTIWKAGFDPADVKWIVHSHGHVDHIGAAVFFKNMFGTKLYLGEPDARDFRERPWISLIQKPRDACEQLFVPDHEITDGEVISFGNITMTFYLCPGHTDGVISCFFDVDGPEGVKRCGYYGGFGFNTLTKSYLTEVGDPEFKMRKTYLESLAKVRDQKVEIFLGNHCVNNDTLGRRKKQIEDPNGPNPFIDDKCWAEYLDEKRDQLLAFMEDPKNN